MFLPSSSLGSNNLFNRRTAKFALDLDIFFVGRALYGALGRRQVLRARLLYFLVGLTHREGWKQKARYSELALGLVDRLVVLQQEEQQEEHCLPLAWKVGR